MSTIQYDTNMSNRQYKASAFTAFFGEPENAADLYRALSHTESISPSDIKYKTLEGVLFLARKNDLAFTAQNRVLVIAEHQSTVNQNMPLRSAIYFGRTAEKLVPPEAIYRTGLIKIPTPEFYMFYNGPQNQPLEKILRLSDAYLEKTPESMLELTVRMININPSCNHPLLKESRSVYEYASFIQSIRDYIAKGLERDQAITAAMEQCVKEGIMADFISKYGSEVRNMLFTQFNIEDAEKVWKKESYDLGMQDGIKLGTQQGICALIETCRECSVSREETLQKAILKFRLKPETAEEYLNRYW